MSTIDGRLGEEDFRRFKSRKREADKGICPSPELGLTIGEISEVRTAERSRDPDETAEGKDHAEASCGVSFCRLRQNSVSGRYAKAVLLNKQISKTRQIDADT